MSNKTSVTFTTDGGGEIGCVYYDTRYSLYVTRTTKSIGYASVSKWRSIDVVLVPDAGNILKKLIVNNEDVTSNVTNNRYSITDVPLKNITCEATFDQEQAPDDNVHKLTLTATGGGEIGHGVYGKRDGSIDFYFTHGSSVTIWANPDDGYKLSKLIVDGKDVTSSVKNHQYTISSMEKDIKCEATFELNTYSLTLKSNGNGMISYNGTSVSSGIKSIEVAKGTNATISITSNSGYKLKKLLVNNSDVTNSVQNNQYTISNINVNTTVEATFEQIQTTPEELTLTLTASGGGSIGYGQYGISGGSKQYSITKGTNVTFWVYPEKGYKLSKLVVDGKDVTANVKDGNYTIGSMSKDISCEATFAVSTHTLTLKSNDHGSVSYDGTTVTNGSKSIAVNDGTNITISVVPNNGYLIKKVTVNGTDVTNQIQNEKYTIKDFMEDTTVEVTFEAIVFTLALTSTGNGSISYNGSAVSNGSKDFNVTYGTDVVIKITPNSGYRLKQLLVDGYDVSSKVSNNQYTMKMNGYTNVKATFEAIPATNYILTLKSNGNGSISYYGTSVSSGSKSIEVTEGTNATITITPNNGYRLSKLLVNNSDVTANVQNNQYTVQNIKSNTTVEASFEVIPPIKYNLTLKSDGNGSISYNGTSVSSGSKSIEVTEGTNATITITPNNGYRLSKLLVNNSDVTANVQNNQYTVQNVKNNTTVESSFEVIPPTKYTLTLKSDGNGSISYNGTSVSSGSKSIEVTEGTNATISVAPNNGYKLAKLMVNNSDVTASVENNQYTVSNIRSNMTAEAFFELQSTGNGTSLDISAVCLGGAYTQSNDLINSGSQLNWSFRNNSNYSVVLKSLQLIDGKTGSEGNIMDVNENVGPNSSVSYAITIGALGIHVPVICRFRYDYDGYEYSTDAFYAGPRSNTVCIKATGEGSVVYNNTTVNNQTSYFILESGKSVEISINPEQGYIIKSVKENGKDCSQNVIDNNYTINGINRDITLEVVFEKFDVSKSFGIRGINYKVVSQIDKTVSVVGVSNSLSGHVTIPESVSPDGHTWRVTQIVSGAFKNQTNLLTLKVPQSISSAGTGLFDGCTGLAAIMWDASVALTNDGVGNVINPNLLVYVWNSGYAPSKIQNVVVNGTAQKIVLKDATSGNNFYCPSAFTAKAISYTHNYSMKSGKGESRGWETLALPFDVQTVSHASKGVLTPFALFKDANSERPFWLYEWTTGGWNAAQAIKANTPYIISMPNHDDYDDKYRLAGDVTFSAENAKVNATSSLQQNSYNGKTFVPCFGELAKGSGIYALNVENSVINNPISDNPGSVFYNNLRGIHPFEGYMKSESNAAKFGVFDDGTITDIPSLPFAEKVPEVIKVYSLSGQLIRLMRNCSLDDATKGLQRGVYVVNGRRLVVDTQ
jgi:hypothetical protein